MLTEVLPNSRRGQLSPGWPWKRQGFGLGSSGFRVYSSIGFRVKGSLGFRGVGCPPLWFLVSAVALLLISGFCGLGSREGLVFRADCSLPRFQYHFNR